MGRPVTPPHKQKKKDGRTAPYFFPFPSSTRRHLPSILNASLLSLLDHSQPVQPPQPIPIDCPRPVPPFLERSLSKVIDRSHLLPRIDYHRTDVRSLLNMTMGVRGCFCIRPLTVQHDDDTLRAQHPQRFPIDSPRPHDPTLSTIIDRINIDYGGIAGRRYRPVATILQLVGDKVSVRVSISHSDLAGSPAL